MAGADHGAAGPAGSAHVTGCRSPPTRRPARLHDSLEWAISAAASIGTHLLVSAAASSGCSRTCRRRRRAHSTRRTDLADYLATIRLRAAQDLAAIGRCVRSAARDSAWLPSLGGLDPASLRMLADAHPRGASVPAFALLLDTGSWVGAGPSTAGDTPSDTDERTAATARVLASAGWRTVVVRRGDTVALAWTSLVRSRGRAS